jgi:lipid-binding SYLF domain-containing protein
MAGFRKLAVATGLAAAMVPAPALARAEATLKDATDAVARLKTVEPDLKRFFEKSAGYAVFPDVAKGGLIVGGAGGAGYLFERSKAVGKTSLSQATIGAQIGGQAYIEIIFFENASYDHGVAVFTLIKGGAMAEASVGGQKFSYEPLGAKKK